MRLIGEDANDGERRYVPVSQARLALMAARCTRLEQLRRARAAVAYVYKAGASAGAL